MTDNILEFPKKPEVQDDWIIGPFEKFQVVIEGRKIPKLSARRTDGGVNISVDERFCAMVSEDIAQDVAWLVAQALAVGSGYACLSSENKDRVFAPLCMKIGSVTTEDVP